MPEPIPIEQLRTLARLGRVNAALSAWAELDAMVLMPPSPRPHVAVPELERDVLEALRAELVAALGEMEGRNALLRRAHRSPAEAGE